MPRKRQRTIRERRLMSRSSDVFFRIIVALNIVAWFLLVTSLIVFHYARPEFITGVQVFWGIDGREFWSQPHLQHLLSLLQASLALSLLVLFLRTKRNRRKTDAFSLNISVLFIISALSLLVLYISL